MNSVGDRLREARLARGLTQEQLAKGLATKGFISQIERHRATPSLAKLRLMAERLQLPLGHFTGDRSPMEVTYLRKSAELAVKAKEPARALELVAEADSHLTTANERADLQRIRGTALDALGQPADALAAHQAAAAAAPPDDPELNATIYAEMGTVLAQQEQFVSAVEADLRAVHWLDRSKLADPGLRARVLTNLGRACWSLGQIDQAHAYLASALDAATDAESLLRIANAHMGLGVTARAKGQLDEAIEHCNRALEVHARIKQERDANRILNNIGDVHYSAGRLDQARIDGLPGTDCNSIPLPRKTTFGCFDDVAHPARIRNASAALNLVIAHSFATQSNDRHSIPERSAAPRRCRGRRRETRAHRSASRVPPRHVCAAF